LILEYCPTPDSLVPLNCPLMGLQGVGATYRGCVLPRLYPANTL
jgi:hypothetical protein